MATPTEDPSVAPSEEQQSFQRLRFSKDLDGNSVLVVKELGEVPGPV